MVLVPNFQPGNILLAQQQGENLAINQAGAIQGQEIQAAQAAQQAQLFPGQLAQQKLTTDQMKVANQFDQLKLASIGKKAESTKLFQSLQRIETMTDPVKRQKARIALNTQANAIFGSVLQGKPAFDGENSDEDGALVMSLIGGASKEKLVEGAGGEQFRFNRSGTALERVPVRESVNQPVPTTPTVGGIPQQGQEQPQEPGTVLSPNAFRFQEQAKENQRKAEVNRLKEARALRKEDIAAEERGIEKTVRTRLREAEKADSQERFILQDERYTGSLDLVTSLLSNDNGLNDAVGPLESRTPALAGDRLRFEADLETLANRLGFEELLKLKKEGATFGALTETEFENISKSVANLKLAQDESTMRKNLRNIKVTLSSAQRRGNAAYKKKWGSLPTADERGILNDSPTAGMPSGTKVYSKNDDGTTTFQMPSGKFITR